MDNIDKTQDNSRWPHRWGYKDTEFRIESDGRVFVTGNRYPISGKHLPYFVSFIERVLHLPDAMSTEVPEAKKKKIPAPILNKSFCKAVEKAFNEDEYTFDDSDRLIHSHGQTTSDEVYCVLYTSLKRVADMVFFCDGDDEKVCQLIELASRHNVCLVPYGGGTSVSCALLLPENETRMIVSVDTRRMNKIEWIDRENNKACVQAGIIGKDLEEQLRVEGYTTGHEPDSVEFSTLGGWIATYASGMKRNQYGNIEDIVENVTLITPKGNLQQKQFLPRTSMGIQPQALVFGSEGNLGLITKAIIKLSPAPEVQKYESVIFPDFEEGVRFLKAVAATKILPASLRLVDNQQFQFGMALRTKASGLKKIQQTFQHFFLEKIKHMDMGKVVVATAVFEGKKDMVNMQIKNFSKVAKQHTCILAGSGNGKRGYLLTYLIAYLRDFCFRYNIMGETYETTIPWDKINTLCDAVQKEAMLLHKKHKLPGIAYVSPRITQLYTSGVCVYFTHGFAAGKVKNPDKVFASIERSLRQVILDNGGAISHHHGVGKLRRPFIPQILDDVSISVLQNIKRSVDPKNIFGVANNVFGLDDEKNSGKSSKKPVRKS